MFNYVPKRHNNGQLVKEADLFWYASSLPRPMVANNLETSLANVSRLRWEWNQRLAGGRDPRVLVNSANVDLGLKMIAKVGWELTAAVAFIRDVPHILQALVDASHRGVDVRLITRPGQLIPSVQRTLDDAGILVRTLDYIHSKLILADGSALVGSANWTQYSAGRNWELGVYLTERSLVKAIREYAGALFRRGFY